jgi:hypothetical protein
MPSTRAVGDDPRMGHHPGSSCLNKPGMLRSVDLGPEFTDEIEVIAMRSAAEG